MIHAGDSHEHWSERDFGAWIVVLPIGGRAATADVDAVFTRVSDAGREGCAVWVPWLLLERAPAAVAVIVWLDPSANHWLTLWAN